MCRPIDWRTNVRVKQIESEHKRVADKRDKKPPKPVIPAVPAIPAFSGQRKGG